MNPQFERTALIFGIENIEKLEKSRVLIFGVGGVGGFAVEALARSGIGAIDIIDNDIISESNLNRQIIALHSTIGKYKVDIMEERIKDINPNCKVEKYKTFYLPENSNQFDFTKYDYIVDCIDTISGKIEIIKNAKEKNIPVISSMGAGNKIDPTKFVVTDISKTSVCPLARVMRRELKNRGIEHLKCVFSTEKSLTSVILEINPETKKQTPGSNAFVPSVAGLIIASEVIKDLVNTKK